MKQKEELAGAKEKSSSTLAINVRLIAVAFTIFIFILSLRPEILANRIVTLQLILSIPVLFASTFARAKLGYARVQKRWDILGLITFTLWYTFLLNVVGILVSLYVNVFIAVIFFAVNWILAMIYSYIEISYDKSKLKGRILSDSFFIILQIVLGLMPALRIF